MFNGPEEVKNISMISNKLLYYKFITNNFVIVDGHWVECGVYKGTTAKTLLKALPQNSEFHLFDSFKGIPEEWQWDGIHIHPKGCFACKPPIFNDKRVTIHKGWFEDTLSKIEFEKPLALLHIDSDLYSSCVTVLKNFHKYIIPGTVILFDEYYNYKNWFRDEYKAFKEYVDLQERKFEYLARTHQYQCAVRITK